MVSPALLVPADAVATLQDTTRAPAARKQALVRMDASAALQAGLISSMITAISQMVRHMTVEWPLEAIESNLTGKEVSDETYELINRFGGLLPAPETTYGCIFFTFTLRQREHASGKGGASGRQISLYIEDVRLVR